MRRGRPKWVAAVVLQVTSLLIAYVLERHLLGPLRSQPSPGDLTGVVWLQAVAWVLVAAFSLVVAWAVLLRARGDLTTSILVTVIGLCAWATTPLAYTAGVGDAIPNWLLDATNGPIGFVQVAAAWTFTVGVFGILLAVRDRRHGVA
jgi:hypothetical protein